MTQQNKGTHEENLLKASALGVSVEELQALVSDGKEREAAQRALNSMATLGGWDACVHGKMSIENTHLSSDE